MGLVPTRDDLRAEQQGGVSLWYIATRAGVSDKSGDWLLNYVRLLIANEHFPKPLPYFGLNERRRQGVGLHSRWIRTAVDAWFDGFLPPHLVTVTDDRNAARDAHLLDARAGELAGAEARVRQQQGAR
jgi:hypothetical protein